VNGTYNDFNSYWFGDIGETIFAAMIFNIFWPFIEFSLFWAIRTVYRMLDQCKLIPNDAVNRTQVKTLQGYEDLYSGPEFLMHYKYSSIMNTVFMCFLFGPVMPLVFPVGLLALITLYSVERLMIFYSYQRPPMVDNAIIRNSLLLFRLCPLLYYIVGMWAFSSN